MENICLINKYFKLIYYVKYFKLLTMENISNMNCTQLDRSDLISIQGGGPIKEAVEWYYKTVGSFYRGIYDGLKGNEPLI